MSFDRSCRNSSLWASSTLPLSPCACARAPQTRTMPWPTACPSPQRASGPFCCRWSRPSRWPSWATRCPRRRSSQIPLRRHDYTKAQLMPPSSRALTRWGRRSTALWVGSTPPRASASSTGRTPTWRSSCPTPWTTSRRAGAHPLALCRAAQQDLGGLSQGTYLVCICTCL